MANILAVGIATVDIINVVDGYPREDVKVRAQTQHVYRGGNATNTLSVLSQLGHQCYWAGVYVNEPDSAHILNDLKAHQIDIANCRVETTGKSPTSYVTLNQQNASRTIVHYRDLPEFSFIDFEKIDLASFDWIHFEGRNIAETLKMVMFTRQHYPNLPISIEVEKARPEIEKLWMQSVDVLFFSKAFAKKQGFDNAADFLPAMRKQNTTTPLFCAWGAKGASVLDMDNQLHYVPARPIKKVVDTLGAGDTFNAGVIHSLCTQQDLPHALNFANQLAGKKCEQLGLKNLL